MFFFSVYCQSSSLVPRPVRAIRVTRGGLEPSAIGEFSRQAWQVTSHPKSPRTTGNEAARRSDQLKTRGVTAVMVISDWCILDQSFAQCKGIQISESKKCLPVESGISGALESGIQLKEFGILLKTGIENPGSKWQRNPESTAWSPECKTVLDSLTWGEKLERPEGATLRCSRSRHSRPRSERSISGINRLSATQARGNLLWNGLCAHLN